MKSLGEYDAERAKQTIDEAYAKGLNDAWEAARKIVYEENNGGIPSKDLSTLFGTRSVGEIICTNDAQEAIEKIKAYEEQKANEIHVGDEVKGCMGKWIVTIIEDGKNYGIDFNGSLHWDYKNEIKKTGRHFPQLEELLKAMEEDNDN